MNIQGLLKLKWMDAVNAKQSYIPLKYPFCCLYDKNFHRSLESLLIAAASMYLVAHVLQVNYPFHKLSLVNNLQS